MRGRGFDLDLGHSCVCVYIFRATRSLISFVGELRLIIIHTHIAYILAHTTSIILNYNGIYVCITLYMYLYTCLYV